MGRAGWDEHELPERIGQPTPLAVRVLSGVVYRLVRVLHRATAEGFENLPETGAYLLVANHPPCTGSGEFFSFMAHWAKRFGGTRPLTGFVHTVGYDKWPLSWGFAQIGAIPSTHAAGDAALARGVPIAVFPGGDHEALQPFWDRHVDFNGREGFLRMARKAGVPIVPMGITGQGAPVIWRSRILSYVCIWPRLFGVKRYALSVLGLAGAIAIGFAVPLAWPSRALRG